ncbi:hypothetical protein ACTXT7_008225 [Hymenolepis weldensis]
MELPRKRRVQFCNQYSLTETLENNSSKRIKGAQRYGKCLKKMFRINFHYLPSIIYCGIVPWFSITLFVFSVVAYGRLTYKHSSGVYDFPHYSVVIGWLLASCSVACIPIVALYRLIKAEGTLWQRLKDLCQPNLTATALVHLEASDEFAPNQFYIACI